MSRREKQFIIYVKFDCSYKYILARKIVVKEVEAMREIDKSLPKDQRILLAAEDVFCRRGYVQATLDEIIALADTGKGTLYKYFGNKDNLFYTLVAGKIEPFLSRLQAVLNSKKSTREKIIDYMLELLPFVHDNKDLYRILWYEVSGNQRGFHPVILNDGSWEMNSLYGDKLPEAEYKRLLRYRNLIKDQVVCLESILSEGMKKGLLKPGQPTISAHHLFGGVTMSVLHYVGHPEFTDEELAVLIADRFLYGHATERN